MEEKKMTKKDYYNQLLNVQSVKENEALVEFINHELELLAKKNSKAKKPTTTQVENDKYRTIIYNLMEVGRGYTVTEMLKTFPELGELTNQKVSAIVRKMCEFGEVTREEIKRKAYFTRVEVEVEDEE